MKTLYDYFHVSGQMAARLGCAKLAFQSLLGIERLSDKPGDIIINHPRIAPQLVFSLPLPTYRFECLNQLGNNKYSTLAIYSGA